MRCVTRLAILAGFLALGCGGDGIERVPIEGILTSQNEPVEGATVQFLPVDGTIDSGGGIGQTDASGKFTLISSRLNDEGVPAGKYRVRVTRLMDGDGTILPLDAAEANFPMSKESIPSPYSGPDSPLEAVVAENGGEIKLDIPVKIPGKRKS